jgi:hypothetical protein
MPEAEVPVVVSAAVEGDVDQAVVRRLVTMVGAHLGPVYGKSGKPALRQKLGGYNNAARHAPWFVLVDLDGDADCAPPLRQEWLPNPSAGLCFRVAVRQVEAWLLADAGTLAAYLGVAKSAVPGWPETLDNAKVAMVTLARRSHRKIIRADMVPRPEAGRLVGPAYTSTLIEYVDRHWRPQIARHHAASLDRAITCVERLIRAAGSLRNPATAS